MRQSGFAMKFLILMMIMHSSTAAKAPLLRTEDDQRIDGKYFVKFKDKESVGRFMSNYRQQRVFRFGELAVLSQYNIQQGVETQLTSSRAVNVVRGFPGVEYVQEISKAKLGATTPFWNLDRIDQEFLPLDDNYSTTETGLGVTVYVIDSGINPDHLDFEERADIFFDAYGGDGIDCNGHGTHVAGTAGGSVFGVAKDVFISSLKVLPGCIEQTDESRIVSAFEYLALNAKKPSVVSMSVYVPSGSTYLDETVKEFISQTNITVVTCAGNDAGPSCNASPGQVPEVITVGASDSDDQRAPFSNYGACTDLYAPGVDIVSATYTGSYNVETLSGTSMATPHVAGAVALLLQAKPTLDPSDIHQTIIQQATEALIQDAQGPNYLIRVNQPRTP